VPLVIHLVHGVDETGSKDSQDNTRQQLQEEAIEPHVQDEQQATPIKFRKLKKLKL
jgi:hypothetical protein